MIVKLINPLSIYYDKVVLCLEDEEDMIRRNTSIKITISILRFCVLFTYLVTVAISTNQHIKMYSVEIYSQKL